TAGIRWSYPTAWHSRGDGPGRCAHCTPGGLEDRAVVLEVGRQRIQAGRVLALAVEMIAVAGHTIFIVDPVADGEVRRHVTPPGAAERVLESDQRDRLAAERDL